MIVFLVIISTLAYLAAGVGVVKIVDLTSDFVREYAYKGKGPVDKTMAGMLSIFWPWVSIGLIFLGLAALYGKLLAKVLG